MLGIPLNEIMGLFTIEPVLLTIIVISKKPLYDKFFLSLIDWDSSPTAILPSTYILPDGALSIICGLKSPGIFNSLVSLCGFLPIEDLADKIDKTKIKNTKIFMGNGKLDQTVPIHYAHGSRDGLIDMGIKPDYREYNSEHTIPNDCLNDVIVWLKKMNE